MKLTHRSSIVLCIVGLAYLSGCAITPKKKEEGPLVWPAPPGKPRIKYIGQLRKRSDVGEQKKEASVQIMDALLGSNKSSKSSDVLVKPYGVYSNGKGRIYVADSATGKIALFNKPEKKFEVIGRSGPGQLTKAMGVVGDKSGNIYVTDARIRRIVVFNPKGQVINTMGGQDVFVKPVGIALDEERSRIYVADSYQHQIIALDMKGKILFRIGRSRKAGKYHNGNADSAWNRGYNPGQFRFPTTIAVGKDGRLIVVDSMNFRIQIFDHSGKFIKKFGSLGDGYGKFARPKGVAVDSQGNIYVSDAGFNNVQIFGPSGKLLLFFGSTGMGRGEFWLPSGMFIDDSDMIYISDQYNHRVQIFQLIREKRAVSQSK